MKKNVFLCVCLNALSSICGWTALGLGISSIISTSWFVILSTPNIYVGLWYSCLQDFLCIAIGLQTEPWLHATRAFIVLMVVFTVVGCLVNLFSQWKFSKGLRMGSGLVFGGAGLFGLIGCSIHAAYVGRSYQETYVNGYGFIVSWTCVGLLFFANLLNFLSAETMPLESQPNTNASRA